MKKMIIVILTLFFTNCNTSRKITSYRNPPQYLSKDYLLLEYIKLTAYPHEYASE
jgi:hypothetical protein